MSKRNRSTPEQRDAQLLRQAAALPRPVQLEFLRLHREAATLIARGWELRNEAWRVRRMALSYPETFADALTRAREVKP
jgi:hypothetical protein